MTGLGPFSLTGKSAIVTGGAAGSLTPEMKQGFIAQIPLGRMGLPDDVGTATLFRLVGCRLRDRRDAGRRWWQAPQLSDTAKASTPQVGLRPFF